MVERIFTTQKSRKTSGTLLSMVRPIREGLLKGRLAAGMDEGLVAGVGFGVVMDRDCGPEPAHDLTGSVPQTRGSRTVKRVGPAG
ncbi:hypothetical protein GCM10027020_33100 [Nocardioides salsibiostraticola]